MLLIEPLEQGIAPATFTVVNTNDAGNGSLRDAIILANRATGLDTIEFEIPGAAVQTIELVSELPSFTDPAFVDGYSQSGSSMNGIAAGNLDGLADIITGRNAKRPPMIEVFSGIDRLVISSFVAFDPEYKGGVRVAATDVNFDGIADIIATTGTKGGSQVKAFHGRTSEEISSFPAFPDFPDVALFAAGTTVVLPDDQPGP